MGWGPKFVQSEIVSTSQALLAASWHQGVNAWLLALSAPDGGVSVGQVFLSYGLDGGADWRQVGGNLPSAGDNTIDAMAVGCEPAIGGVTAYAIVHAQTAATLTVATISVAYAVGAGGSPPAWSVSRTLASSSVTSAEFASFVGTSGPVAIYATGSAVAADVSISSTLNVGGTWSDFSPYSALGGATAKWLLKTSGTLAVACPAFWQPAAPALWTSPDGVTWTNRALPMLTGFAVVSGLTWNALAQLWYMAVQVTASTVAFYSSPDAITWTLVQPTPSWAAMPAPGPSNNQIADLESLGGSLVVTLGNPTAGGPGGMVFSPDLGVSWYPSQAVFPNSDAAAIIGIRSRLAASPTGLLAINNYWGRFSELVGLPNTTI